MDLEYRVSDIRVDGEIRIKHGTDHQQVDDPVRKLLNALYSIYSDMIWMLEPIFWSTY